MHRRRPGAGYASPPCYAHEFPGYFGEESDALDKNERSFLNCPMSKGAETRQAILDEALVLASTIGVAALSVGALAERTGMSKSGLFAHFGSKEEMQLAVLRAAEERFLDVVFRPSLRAPRGLARLRALFANMITWTEKSGLPGGCPIEAAAHEFDDKPGPVRDAVAASRFAWRRTLTDAVRKAVETGELGADTDPAQFAFEIDGIAMACHQTHRLFDDPDADRRALTAFERLVRDHLAKE